MDERTNTASTTTTAIRGTCEECGRYSVLTQRIDPESPLTDSLRLCASCARAPEPFWHDDR
jgi:hypothetical protein